MTNEEAFKIALENVTAETWVPKEWAFNQPLKVVWFECRLAQVYNYWLNTGLLFEEKELPKTLKELKKIEKTMDKYKKTRNKENN